MKADSNSIQAAGEYFSDAREHAAEIRNAQSQYLRDHGAATRTPATFAFLLAGVLSALALCHFT